MEKCKHIIKIPTKFCLNVQIAGAIVMYDRVKSLGTYSKNQIYPGFNLIMNDSLVGLNKKELNTLLTSMGVPEKQLNMRTNQLWNWIY